MKRTPKAKAAPKPVAPEYPKVEVADTFAPHFTLFRQHEPSCMNYDVRVERFRVTVTVEKIDEPKEVVQARLQKFWEDGENIHHYGPIEAMAKRLGVVLAGAWGAKRVYTRETDK